MALYRLKHDPTPRAAEADHRLEFKREAILSRSRESSSYASRARYRGVQWDHSKGEARTTEGLLSPQDRGTLPAPCPLSVSSAGDRLDQADHHWRTHNPTECSAAHQARRGEHRPAPTLFDE